MGAPEDLLAARAEHLQRALEQRNAMNARLRNLVLFLARRHGLDAELEQVPDEHLLAQGLAGEEVAMLRDLLRPLRSFSWLRGLPLAGCARPMSRAGLEALFAEGVRTLISLTDDPLPAAWFQGLDLLALHIPLPDEAAPEPAQLARAAAAIAESLAAGRPVAVHCVGGRGRTTTVLAAYLVAQGQDPAHAVEEIKGQRPQAAISPDQLAALYAFAQDRNR